MITYNLTKDFSKEWIPSQVLVCLRMALIADKSGLAVLPKFEVFHRQMMQTSVKVVTNPISLRSIIGNRQTMLDRGHFIISSLLRGLQELRGAKFVMRNI